MFCKLILEIEKKSMNASFSEDPHPPPPPFKKKVITI